MSTEKRLISLDDVISKLHAEIDTFGHIRLIQRLLQDVIDYLVKQPTVEAVEVVHGRWEWYTDRCEDLFLGCDEDYGWRCSHCETPLEDCDDPEVSPTFSYCPNCGAKMDGDGNG